jgi:hypothetical protein
MEFICGPLENPTKSIWTFDKVDIGFICSLAERPTGSIWALSNEDMEFICDVSVSPPTNGLSAQKKLLMPCWFVFPDRTLTHWQASQTWLLPVGDADK